LRLTENAASIFNAIRQLEKGFVFRHRRLRTETYPFRSTGYPGRAILVRMHWQPPRNSSIFRLMPTSTLCTVRALQQHHPVRLRRRGRRNAG
jgi:hypothetical protein